MKQPTLNATDDAELRERIIRSLRTQGFRVRNGDIDNPNPMRAITENFRALKFKTRGFGKE